MVADPISASVGIYFICNWVGAIVVSKLFNWSSTRARLSRYGHVLGPWVTFLNVLSLALVIFGSLMLAIELPLGWVLLGIAFIPAMVSQWHGYELKNVPIAIDDDTIQGKMDSDLLALLPKRPTPKDLALALMNISGGLFFEIRFGVGGNFLKDVVSESTDDTEVVFKEALKLSDKLDNRISPGVMILALLKQVKIKQSILGYIQLDENDLLNGIIWYHRLGVVIDRQKLLPKQPGGIGRDWSFGWIPSLSYYGTNISKTVSYTSPELRQDLLEQVQTSLVNGGTVAVIGKNGVGKTELVYTLASSLMYPGDNTPNELRYYQVFMLDASRLLTAANERGGVENLVSLLLSEAFTAKNIIVCLDNAELFFEDKVGSVDISTLLTPIIQAGRLKMILTIDEQNFLKISKNKPDLAGALTKIVVEPTNEKETLRVVEDSLPMIEYAKKVTFMYQSIKEAYRLGARYVYDTSMPGQALQLLRQAADYPESEARLVTSRSIQKVIEQTTGVKTSQSSDASEREMLLQLENLIHQRMIGQERAVAVVSDALRRARAGIRNQNRPVGTFLFLGPTGVGKTELAKTLAEVYFGGEKNIIRLDMNEFVSAKDVSRLIADGSDDAGSLTAQIMKQPFSVVLLDEIEKAHSSVLTTFLQMLDEGILRDERGREVSFKDAVIIATSNAGANRVIEYLQRGYKLEQFEQKIIEELISSQLFHPEFLNRFDEIVVFEPLNKAELLQVVDLILVGVNKNLETQKITVTVTDDGKEYLVEQGYDPLLGARPMRRVVQRTVENLIAKLLLASGGMPGQTIEINKKHLEAVLDKKKQADDLANIWGE